MVGKTNKDVTTSSSFLQLAVELGLPIESA